MPILQTPAALWHIVPLTDDTRRNLVSLYGEEIDKLVQDAFGDQTSMPLDQLNAALDESNYVGLLVINGALIGFVLAYIPVVTIKNKHFIWLNKLMVAAAFQGQHYGSARTLVEAFRLSLPFFDFGFIGARTQSPGLLKSFVNLSPVNYPFTKQYTHPVDEDGIKLLIFCFLFIPQLHGIYNPDDPFAVSVGIFIGAYRRQLGLGLPEKGSPEAEGLLNKLDFKRERGDAILVVSQL